MARISQKTTRRKASSRKAAAKRPAAKKAASKKTAARKPAPRKWSKKVNETSNAMDLEQGVFKEKDPKKIAASLKESAGSSRRRKASPFQSAMSMLNFYINRGGKNLPEPQKKVLEEAKEELRKLFGKEE